MILDYILRAYKYFMCYAFIMSLSLKRFTPACALCLEHAANTLAQVEYVGGKFKHVMDTLEKV